MYKVVTLVKFKEGRPRDFIEFVPDDLVKSKYSKIDYYAEMLSDRYLQILNSKDMPKYIRFIGTSGDTNRIVLLLTSNVTSINITYEHVE